MAGDTIWMWSLGFCPTKPTNLTQRVASLFAYLGNWVQLDQVNCAWLFKWVVKCEIFKLTKLCLTRWLIISGTWCSWVRIWRYWLVLGQYKLILLGIRWYRVSKGFVGLNILGKVEIWSGDIQCLTQRQTTEDSATQLVYSIKFKLSHAINWRPS